MSTQSVALLQKTITYGGTDALLVMNAVTSTSWPYSNYTLAVMDPNIPDTHLFLLQSNDKNLLDFDNYSRLYRIILENTATNTGPLIEGTAVLAKVYGKIDNTDVVLYLTSPTAGGGLTFEIKDRNDESVVIHTITQAFGDRILVQRLLLAFETFASLSK